MELNPAEQAMYAALDRALGMGLSLEYAARIARREIDAALHDDSAATRARALASLAAIVALLREREASTVC